MAVDALTAAGYPQGMTAQVATILEQVSKLTSDERAELVAALARFADADADAEQAELQRRIADYRSNAVPPVSFEAGVAEIRDRLAERRTRRHG